MVNEPDLSKCRKGKDFGRGFYLTTDRIQAVRFTKTAIRKAVSDGIVSEGYTEGYLSIFEYMADETLSIFEFEDADREWLHCVAAHRKLNRSFRRDKWIDYDIIAGKIANDQTNLVLTAYLDGLYGEIGSAGADRIAIGFLEPDNLKNQVCFRTEKALRCLEFVESVKVGL